MHIANDTYTHTDKPTPPVLCLALWCLDKKLLQKVFCHLCSLLWVRLQTNSLWFSYTGNRTSNSIQVSPTTHATQEQTAPSSGGYISSVAAPTTPNCWMSFHLLLTCLTEFKLISTSSIRSCSFILSSSVHAVPPRREEGEGDTSIQAQGSNYTASLNIWPREPARTNTEMVCTDSKHV